MSEELALVAYVFRGSLLPARPAPIQKGKTIFYTASDRSLYKALMPESEARIFADLVRKQAKREWPAEKVQVLIMTEQDFWEERDYIERKEALKQK